MRFPPVCEGGPGAAPTYLCLAGPTAAGKSAAALAIAEALAPEAAFEIVSVDSALVYRSMDIGTAKPNADERRRVPHHLIDILDPSDAYSAARFTADATLLIGDITGRGHLPLLVGGTMLYFKALAGGLDAMPAADPAIRAELDAEAADIGWPALHAELVTVDPATARRLAPNDSQRIQRALEVYRVSGQALSSWQRGAGTAWQRGAGAADRCVPPTMISLEPADRSWLHERIARRFALMLADGLVDEVRRLRERGDLHPGLPSMRCVGYRQIRQALDRGGGGAELQAAAEQAISATRQLAKRQMTWLRAMPWRRSVACDSPDALAQVVDHARNWLTRPCR